jgi:hypothetical protein
VHEADHSSSAQIKNPFSMRLHSAMGETLRLKGYVTSNGIWKDEKTHEKPVAISHHHAEIQS